jgi:hypothetical protein
MISRRLILYIVLRNEALSLILVFYLSPGPYSPDTLCMQLGPTSGGLEAWRLERGEEVLEGWGGYKVCHHELRLNFILITLSSPPLGLPRPISGGVRYKTQAQQLRLHPWQQQQCEWQPQPRQQWQWQHKQQQQQRRGATTKSANKHE